MTAIIPYMVNRVCRFEINNVNLNKAELSKFENNNYLDLAVMAVP